MLFTSTTAPFRQTPSLQFREKGDLDGYPGKCESAHIFATSGPEGHGWAIARAMITPTVLANFNRGPSYLACAAIWRQSVPALAAPPQVGISFSNLTEAIEATVHGMGFVSDTHGRFKYYGLLRRTKVPFCTCSQCNCLRS